MDKEIVEGNKLIAEFMKNHAINSPHLKNAEELQYHTSWDWLMPVVEKIHAININIGERADYTPQGSTFIISLWPPFEIEIWNETGYHYKQKGDDLKNETWRACIQFIKWYNQNKQP